MNLAYLSQRKTKFSPSKLLRKQVVTPLMWTNERMWSLPTLIGNLRNSLGIVKDLFIKIKINLVLLGRIKI